MRFIVIFALLLPLVWTFVCGASETRDKRLFEALLGVDVRQVANQLAAQFADNTNEQLCEVHLCPETVHELARKDNFGTMGEFAMTMLCAAACKEAQVLAQHHAANQQ